MANLNNIYLFGSGCGAVGRAVASDTRGHGFESSHQQLLLNIYLLLTVCRKDKNKEKETGNGPFFQKKIIYLTDSVICGQSCKHSTIINH